MKKETAEKLVNDCIRELETEFDNIADIALHNQEKVLDAFRKNAVDGTPSRRSLRTRSAPKAPSSRP